MWRLGGVSSVERPGRAGEKHDTQPKQRACPEKQRSLRLSRQKGVVRFAWILESGGIEVLLSPFSPMHGRVFVTIQFWRSRAEKSEGEKYCCCYWQWQPGCEHRWKDGVDRSRRHHTVPRGSPGLLCSLPTRFHKELLLHRLPTDPWLRLQNTSSDRLGTPGTAT